jgi:malate permease and related proteins
MGRLRLQRGANILQLFNIRSALHMSLLSVIINVIGPVILIVSIGILFDRKFHPDPRGLSRTVIYVFTPSLLLTSIAGSDLQPREVWQITAVAVLSPLIISAFGLLLSRRLGFDRALTSAFLLSISLVNVGNYGLPLNDFAFGSAGLERALVYFVVSTVWTNTVGVFLASSGKASLKDSLLNVFKTPLPYATALGLLLNVYQIDLPLPIYRTVFLLGQATIPAALVVLGLQLSRASFKGRIRPILLATATRLIGGPLTAFLLVALLGVTGVARQVCIIQASMPCGVLSGVLAAEFGSDVDFATSAVLISTVGSVISLSLLLWMVG